MCGKRSHNPYDWALSQTGDISPGKAPAAGVTGLPIETAGLTIKGVDPFYQTKHLGAWDEDEEEYNTSQVRETYLYGSGGTKSWGRGWYDPAFESLVRAPLRSHMGISGESLGAAGANVDTSVSPLRTLTEAFGGQVPEFITSAEGYSGVSQATGYDEGVIHKDVVPDIMGATTDYGFREGEHATEMGRLEQAEEDIGDVRKEGLLESRIARTQALSGRAPEYEEARAAEAATGMAYSAPAGQEGRILKEENIAELSDIKRDEATVEKTYKTDLEEIEGARDVADTTLSEQRAGYLGDLQTSFQASEGLMNEFAQAGSNILQGWQDWGTVLQPGGDSRGKIKGKSKYGGGYQGVGGEWFDEHGVHDVAPEFNLLAQITGQSKALSNWLLDTTGSALPGLGDDS